MERLSTTPFGARPVSAALLATTERVARQANVPHADKWTIFRDLCVGRAAFGVSDRDLSVLNALLSFHRGASLSDNEVTVVFPSNAALSERAHGMAESTLRRHLAALTRAGLVLRHDSPNGKRYARKSAAGDVVVAFGFDLRPLLVRAQEIAGAAQAARDAIERMKMQRERLSLAMRDAAKLVAYVEDASSDQAGSAIEQLLSELFALRSRARRRLDERELDSALADATALVQVAMELVQASVQPSSEKMDGNDADNERRHQNSKTDASCFEPLEHKHAKNRCGEERQRLRGLRRSEETTKLVEDVPFALVREACRELAAYNGGRLDGWRDVTRAAHFVRGLMGVSPSAWEEAVDVMGNITASLTLGCMLERSSEIRNPGGYLRALIFKARSSQFTPIGMLMAILKSAPPVRSAVQKVDSCQPA
ncbi:plasmid replication protein RepC [Rubrimonas cliftonensis]|uniref:Replication initiation protein RepC n=1 Tax=Rubrimonas cliftonensis TaxID=89524 RepID=A0A1H4ET04_9RHOB|nr:plasmid replication protein RepC [Rubrimonas cliftonensis]SEA88057.1 replication initiation protein RepC [Rubrimonas cliftonensis]